jgi:NAD(P)-dependent dehydrogenase (short-subunit alcohol dehydrogenase family)
MSGHRKTAIVTGASQGIGAGIVRAFAERGFNVVANSRKVTQSAEVAASDGVALVDGDIGDPATAARIVEAALSRFQSIDELVNPASLRHCANVGSSWPSQTRLQCTSYLCRRARPYSQGRAPS